MSDTYCGVVVPADATRPPYHYWPHLSPQVLIDAADSYDELAAEPNTSPEEVTELHAIAGAIRRSVSLRREIVFS